MCKYLFQPQQGTHRLSVSAGIPIVWIVLFCHGQLVGRLLVAGRQLVLDPGHQVVGRGEADGLLDHIQPPRRAQVDLPENRFVLTFLQNARGKNNPLTTPSRL